ncbi:Actin/actin-like protein [Metschnikowia bicuspidata]|uniref:Centractin n=1 Tax=Metschnikowia bicuspidata TaxID=27322 RepID=A0A4P9Z8H7_9ASCO|nr:Actin/actin-like protein [Metschnikowia bicuspidata]
MEERTLYNQPVVLDNGSGNLKAGFAGEDRPKHCMPTVVGRPKYQKVMAALLFLAIEPSALRYNNDETYIGTIAQQNRGLLKLSHPMEHGVVTDWDDMERVWSHAYSAELKTAPEDHPLLITEAPLNPRANRDRICQVLFETMGVPCVYVSIQAVLSLYASGRTTGVVVAVGDGVGHVVPVYDGFSLPTSVKRMDVAGRDVTDHLAFNIRRMSGVTFLSSAELDVVRCIKEQCCYLSKDPVREEKRYLGVPYSRYVTPTADDSGLFATYKLPDGNVLSLGVEQFRAPEILFNPQLIGDESPGIHQLTALAIAKTDMDLRPTLYQNVVLSGGSTLLRNFGDRMLSELRAEQLQQSIAGSLARASKDSLTKIKIYAPPERKYSTWIGGSILAGLSTFRKLWVTSQEYSADPDIVHRKFM